MIKSERTDCMYAFDKIPNYVYDILSDKGADVENIYIATYCDMDTEHNFCDTYVLCTNEYLYVLSGFETLVIKKTRAKDLISCGRKQTTENLKSRTLRT